MSEAGGGPAHRVEAVLERGRRVRAEIAGVPVADTRNPVLLHETGYPMRVYFPPEDVRFAHLVPTDTRTHCPFKGDAEYWSFTAEGVPAAAAVPPDVAWSYPQPLPTVAAIKGHLAFYGDHVHLVDEGEGADSTDDA